MDDAAGTFVPWACGSMSRENWEDGLTPPFSTWEKVAEGRLRARACLCACGSF
ncbi:hypothetical protein [Stratiformator vulcanicus]|uniref:Uncharacterized protein n=1 Tax=Stratiformator vulcanicus TaxID=2527980 RepID=A0A517R022_9PLAN|nr:hypothetical protein [Stratiformator vulcanicus]QDT37231.1 hypothetical protein Pan189_16040 [Stratiformator vulcanicus]